VISTFLVTTELSIHKQLSESEPTEIHLLAQAAAALSPRCEYGRISVWNSRKGKVPLRAIKWPMGMGDTNPEPHPNPQPQTHTCHRQLLQVTR